MTTEAKRKYVRVSPAVYPIIVKLHEEHGFTYQQVADLFGCSRSRVVQITSAHKETAA